MRRKPELVDVQVIEWDTLGGLYGVMTTYDDGVIEREPWSDLAHTRLTVALRRMEIRQEQLPRRSTLDLACFAYWRSMVPAACAALDAFGHLPPLLREFAHRGFPRRFIDVFGVLLVDVRVTAASLGFVQRHDTLAGHKRLT